MRKSSLKMSKGAKMMSTERGETFLECTTTLTI